MTRVDLGETHFDEKEDSLSRYFQTQDPENSGIITLPFDPEDPLYHSMLVEPREPLRQVNGNDISGAIIVGARRNVLIRRIQSDELMMTLINGLINQQMIWPINTQIDGPAPLHPEDDLWELSL